VVLVFRPWHTQLSLEAERKIKVSHSQLLGRAVFGLIPMHEADLSQTFTVPRTLPC